MSSGSELRTRPLDAKPARTRMLLFVYGTLCRGEPNHRVLGKARFVAHVRTAPFYDLVDLGHFPALLEGGSTAVHGELYEVDESWVGHVDAFEDVPVLYDRKPVRLEGRAAIGYVMRPEVAGAAPRIASGDWRRHASRQQPQAFATD